MILLQYEAVSKELSAAVVVVVGLLFKTNERDR